MWKKEEPPTPPPVFDSGRMPPPGAPSSPETPAPASSSASGRASSERAVIGRSISIQGDVTGEEDLLIQGRVEGSIELNNHAVTIGSEGEVRASVSARLVVVEGQVEGNISSEEQVVLRASARVQGDITAPRLVLEDGARFRGGVDMGEIPGSAGPEATMPGGDSGRTVGSASQSSANGAAGEKGSGKGSTGAESSAGKGKGAPPLVVEA